MWCGSNCHRASCRDRLTFISMANMECPIKPNLHVFDWRRWISAKEKIHFSMLLIWNPERRRVHRRVSLGGSCHFTLPRFERRLQPFTHNCLSDCLKSTISITVHPCDRLREQERSRLREAVWRFNTIQLPLREGISTGNRKRIRKRRRTRITLDSCQSGF